jgi:predicted SAM-dependent methyltransferase
MVKEDIGLTETLNPEPPMLGYTDKSTVKLDFDDASFKFVKCWALRTMKWFRLRGFIILKSSKNHYHVVFDRSVTWKRNMHIVAWVALESQNEKLKVYQLMQCIEESSTLRGSKKKEKSSPRIVLHYGKKDKEIENFLLWRKRVKRANNERKRKTGFKNGNFIIVSVCTVLCMKLDVGCGARKTSSGYVGLDISKSPNVNIMASATALPFRNESFVEIYTRRCFQHIGDDEKAIAEVSRVIQKNGKAKLIFASWRGWVFYQVKWLFKKKPYDVFHLYTFRKLKRIFEKQSFRSIKIGKIKSARRFGYDIIVEVKN